MTKADKRQIWEQRIAACERSGMSRRAWCVANGANANSYGYWHRRLRTQQAAPAGTMAPRQALVPVSVQSSPRSTASSAAVDIALPNGIVLRTPVSIEVRMLAALVRELRAC